MYSWSFYQSKGLPVYTGFSIDFLPLSSLSMGRDFPFDFLFMRDSTRMTATTATISRTRVTATPIPTPAAMAAEDWPEEEVWSMEGMGDGEV